MEIFSISSPKFPMLAVSQKPSGVMSRRRFPVYPSLPSLMSSWRRRAGRDAMRAGTFAFAFNHSGSSRRSSKEGRQKFETQDLASISSANNKSEGLTTSTSTPPVLPPSTPSYIGSPLLWIGIGVGLSVVFQVVSARAKRYVLQQTFKSMMGQAAPQNTQFSNPFPPGSGFPFPPGSGFPFPDASTTIPTVPPPIYSQPVVNIDVKATEVEPAMHSQVGGQTEKQEPQKQQAFVDVTPEELLKDDRAYSQESTKSSDVEVISEKEVSSNGTFKQGGGTPGEESQQRKQILSVEALEKMMEDPTVQKMVYPYIPEELRNPTSFKWLMQNPQFRQQMQDMLSNMGGSGEWDNRLMDSLNNFDLSSPEVKQQFAQVGLTPEEVISKILANPDVAMAFQNPKVQAAIMDISQNPMSIAKYQNDKEVMDVLNKISELFPGMSG